MTSSNSSIITTEQFLDEIHGPNSPIYFNVAGKSWKHKPQTYQEARPKLKWLNNEKQKDIYYIVNSGGTKDSQITRINSVFIDWDAGRGENNNYFSDQIVFEKKQLFLPKINTFTLKPSFIIETRNGYQVYWLMYPGVPNNQFVELQERLSAYFMSDNKVTNPARAMRLPNYYWIKPNSNCNSFFVRIITHNSIRYYYDTLLEVFPSIPASEIVKGCNGENSKKGTHNNAKSKEYNTLNIIVGPIVNSSKKKTIVSNMNEVIEYLQQQDIAQYLNVKISKQESNHGSSIYCPFHNDHNPSASIYLGQNNHYMLKCHSSNCCFGEGSIIQVVEQLEGIEENEAITLLMQHFNLRGFNSQVQHVAKQVVSC